jgi:hypothetical protein
VIKSSITPFFASLTIGLQFGYEKVLISKSEVIAFIQEYQDQLIKEKQIYLSASITECIILLSGQNEPHLIINFINYPRFPLKISVLKFEIEELTKQLMTSFRQKRVVIEFLDETVMFEDSKEIDPRIQKS